MMSHQAQRDDEWSSPVLHAVPKALRCAYVLHEAGHVAKAAASFLTLCCCRVPLLLCHRLALARLMTPCANY
jgi:hypothetical protein